jgi:uncharacterized membrane protein YfcA
MQANAPLLFWMGYAITGFLAGTLAGLLGVGGGIIIVPVLAYLFELQGFAADTIVHLALGTSLASIVFTSLSSVRAHHRRQSVSWRVVGRITPGIVGGTYLGSRVAAELSTPVLKVFFALFLFAVATQMLSGAEPRPTRTLPDGWGVAMAGLIIGGVSALVGIGGGSLSVPFLIWCNVGTRRAIGTSAAIGFPIALSGAAGYVVNGLGAVDAVPYALGYVYLPALAGVALVSVVTAPLGARLTHSVDPNRVKRVFALLLLIMGLRMGWDVMASGVVSATSGIRGFRPPVIRENPFCAHFAQNGPDRLVPWFASSE